MYTVIVNQPGWLPEEDPHPAVATLAEARLALAADLAATADTSHDGFAPYAVLRHCLDLALGAEVDVAVPLGGWVHTIVEVA